MASSTERIQVNRQNAQHSTGPKTEEGKKVSALNALRDGFNSPVDVLPHEDMLAYLGLRKEFKETWQPKGAYEERLVQTMTSQQWRLLRCASIENSMFALGHATLGDKLPDVDDAAIHATLTAARSFMANPRALDTLSRHEYRINRIYQNTLKELLQVQSMRKAREEADLFRAANLYKTAKMRDLPYHPADDGFVLTNAEIEQYISRNDRRTVAAIGERCNFNLKKFREAMAA
jgi:hypothetical protein